jgi:ferredoxin hydrogenase
MNEQQNVIRIDSDICTGCGRCKDVCPVGAVEGVQGTPHSIREDVCVLCGQCVQQCSAFASFYEQHPACIAEKKRERGLFVSEAAPLFAAWHTGDAPRVASRLAEGCHSMVQCAPAVRAAIGEEFGMPAGALTPGRLAAALRRLGFDRVYDTNFAADLTIMEEGSELLQRMEGAGPLPMFTSCCPAWVRYAEQQFPDLLEHLSSCKSPQQMAGAVFKSYGAQLDGVDPRQVFSVAVMPCTCKKAEAQRPGMEHDGVRDVDVVLTTGELAAMLRQAHIDFAALPDEPFDRPLGSYSGAGNIFGLTGGVMEAALRTAYELVTGEPVPCTELVYVRGGEGIRHATLTMDGRTFRVAVVAGLQHVRPLLEAVRAGTCDVDFVEVMCCPQGCISGGGQPKVLLPFQRDEVYAARKAALYRHDAELSCRKSHENPQVQALYREFLGEPLGHVSHNLLHTVYGQTR